MGPFNVTAQLGNESLLVIGDKTTIGGALFRAAWSRIVVGRDCLFSMGINVISAQDHGIVKINTNGYELLQKDSAVIIGDHVWVGHGAYLIGGSTIGSGSIVGASAVVPNNVPKNSIVVGSPALVVKTNTTWSRFSRAIDRETEAYLKGLF